MDQARVSKDPLIGRMLLGRYRIVRELAKGGMGVVYLARAEGAVGFVKPVVVKLILQEFAEDQRYMGMFAREAQILSNLRDPSIVDVLEFGEDDGNYVMVLEYVRGYHLGQWKRYLRRIGRKVPTEAAIQIAIDVLQALHHAHSARHPDGESMHIVHRDVSPSNILLDGNGRARLLDFGVARMRGGSHGYKTKVKGFVGKDQYIAPEIFAGADASSRSDLYACGVVLHEVLFGQNAFRARTQAATLHRVLHHVPEPVAGTRNDVPEGLDTALACALAKDPEERFATAADFADALRALLSRPEHAVREELATLLADDFTEEMANMLGIESLTARDEAWRRLGVVAGADSGVRTSDPPTVAAAAAPSLGAPPASGSPEDKTRVASDHEDVTVVSSVDLVTSADQQAGGTASPSDSPKTVVSSAGDLVPPPAALVSTAPPPPAALVSTAPPPPPARRLSAPPPPPEGASLPPAPGRASLPPVPRVPPPAAGGLPASVGPQLGAPSIAPSPPPAPRQSRVMLFGLIGVAILAVASIALSLLGGPRTAAPAPPSIRVVQQPLPAPSEATKAPTAAESADREPPSNDVGQVAAPGASEGSPEPEAPVEQAKSTRKPVARRPKSKPDPKPEGPDLASLTRAFRGRQAAVRRCLEQSAASVGQARMEVEFRLSAAGKVQHARVLPRALAKTDVGQCVQRVAQQTRFPAQGEPVEFAIPVTARLVQ